MARTVSGLNTLLNNLIEEHFPSLKDKGIYVMLDVMSRRRHSKKHRKSITYAGIRGRCITVHRILLSGAVPVDVVKHWLYHEVLHYIHGKKHDKKFGALEAQSPWFDKAMTWHNDQEEFWANW